VMVEKPRYVKICKVFNGSEIETVLRYRLHFALDPQFPP
jgi:ABC-type uncharacterized transport system permease subunit